MTTKQPAEWKIHSNKPNVNLCHTEEYRMLMTAKHQNYSIKGKIEEYEYRTTSKKKQKLVHKLAEEWDFNKGEMLYLDIRPQEIQVIEVLTIVL